MTNDENRKIARDTSVILCDVFDRQEMEDVIAMKYAPAMAELERALDLLECVKIESQNIVAGGPSYPITQPLRAAR